MIAALLLAGAASVDACAVPQARDAAAWKGIATAGFVLPEGTSADAAFLELDALFASRDPEIRDGVGYEAVVAWTYKERKVSDATLQTATARWREHLRCGIGSTRDDRVFLRSFSALAASITAAADLRKPWRDKAGFDTDLDAALSYLAAEKDVRGFVDGAGWAHATAHTADWLKFLARSPHLTPQQATRILDGIAAKLEGTTEPFVRGEQERLAATVLSIARRSDFDAAAFKGWAERLAGLERAVWQANPFDPARHSAAMNAKGTLLALYVVLDLAPGEGGNTAAAKTALAEALRR